VKIGKYEEEEGHIENFGFLNAKIERPGCTRFGISYKEIFAYFELGLPGTESMGT